MFTFLVTQSLKNRLLVCALSGVLVLLGLLSVSRLPVDVLPDHGLGRHEPHGVRVRGMEEYLLRRALFHDSSGIHDNHEIRHLGNHAQVVGNKQNTHAIFVAQRFYQCQHPFLNRYIQCGGGFVSKD